MEPNGNGTCTWNYEEAGEISLDELVGIKDYDSWKHGHREYDPETDEGVKFSWWNGINSTSANEERVRQASELFDKKYPTMPTVAELTNPPCDFDFGYFYKEWYRKDGYRGPCGPPSAKCKGGIWVLVKEFSVIGIIWFPYYELKLNPLTRAQELAGFATTASSSIRSGMFPSPLRPAMMTSSACCTS